MTEKAILALHGGEPVRSKYLSYGKQLLDDADIEAVIQVLRSDFLTTGPVVERFESAIAEYTGAKYAVAFSNGTAALHAACFAAGIKAGDEVITTPMTFAASANCVLYMGGTPVFADIDPVTYNIDPKSVEMLITEKTKAIIPVDFTGQPADLDDFIQMARDKGIIVIEDAAHALGASYNGRKVGAVSDMTMFSFHPVKPITTGEGGVIATNNYKYFEKLQQFRTHGITRNPAMLIERHGPWYYEMQELGYNYRMTELQAALGLSQMNKLDKFIIRRRQIADLYNDAFRSIKQVTLPHQKKGNESGWHLYILRLKLEHLSAVRREIFEAFQAENIGVNVHYLPVYWHPYYKKLGYAKGLCPESEHLYETIITLPLFPAMTEGDVEDVISAVQKVISYYSKG
ncbi:UDP-4-amino-4,6-dideoxy-N-acetyl-beta-L-altrosamine transaminase [Paenibacillus sp. N4]|uniref:UDP-4-amino-4, 6-dideoxy-N-acetyl-beta-L-altrosamine transaminase n=1 Tax=Paenibacillus vietnamensis TaxID=2590547 RepID=UPI001CD0FC7B|nr:UDP-4-amino-4,6-dideoxy-N-acetyl-beta-L-altrosamine transaminase [Paenibacillus vietnamensis]MCA0754951.1 UDP-4-amino-4,6-dideoxy-N-acetyl-beta-L-altrosamine transaminase [Paenibacillus vietnamensis]